MHIVIESNASSIYANSLQDTFQITGLHDSSRVNLTLFFRKKSFEVKYVTVLIRPQIQPLSTSHVNYGHVPVTNYSVEWECSCINHFSQEFTNSKPNQGNPFCVFQQFSIHTKQS